VVVVLVTIMLPTALLALALANRTVFLPAVPPLPLTPEVQALEQGIQDTLTGQLKVVAVYVRLRADAQERCRGRVPTPAEKKEIDDYSTKIAELQQEIADTEKLLEKVRAREVDKSDRPPPERESKK